MFPDEILGILAEVRDRSDDLAWAIDHFLFEKEEAELKNTELPGLKEVYKSEKTLVEVLDRFDTSCKREHND